MREERYSISRYIRSLSRHFTEKNFWEAKRKKAKNKNQEFFYEFKNFSMNLRIFFYEFKNFSMNLRIFLWIFFRFLFASQIFFGVFSLLLKKNFGGENIFALFFSFVVVMLCCHFFGFLVLFFFFLVFVFCFCLVV